MNLTEYELKAIMAFFIGVGTAIGREKHDTNKVIDSHYDYALKLCVKG